MSRHPVRRCDAQHSRRVAAEQWHCLSVGDALPTLTPHRRSNILRVMKYSDAETYGNRTDEELLDAAMPLLQAVGAALHAAILQISQTYHLTPAQVKVLLQLGSRGQMTMGEVATGLCASMPAVSELVDRLVDAGHLVRATDPGDRRRVLIEATPEAQRVGAHFCELRRAQLRYALAQFAPEERSVFVRSLEALLAGLTYDEQSRSIQCPRPTPPSEPLSPWIIRNALKRLSHSRAQTRRGMPTARPPWID